MPETETTLLLGPGTHEKHETVQALEEEEEEGIKVVKEVGIVSEWRKRPPGKKESEGSDCFMKWGIVVVGLLFCTKYEELVLSVMKMKRIWF